MTQTRYGSSFWLLGLISLLAFVSYDLIRSPLLPLFAERLGARPEAIGLIVGVSTLTGVLFKLPAGSLSDLLGRRVLLFIGLAVFAIAPYFYFFVDRVWHLVLLRVFHGFATAIFAPVAMAVVADMVPKRRGEALGWYSSFGQTGRLSGRMLGGYIILWFGFYHVFWISGIIGVILILLFLRLRLPNNRSESEPVLHHSPTSIFNGIREVGSDGRILITSGMEAVLMTASGSLMAFLPIMGIQMGLHAGEVGLLFGGMGLASIFTKPMMGRVSDRIGRRPMIILGQTICAGVMIALPWMTGFMALFILSMVFGLGEAIMGSSTSAMVADLCKERSLGSAMGVFGTIMDIGHAAGPILTGFLIGMTGTTGAFTAVGLLLLLMTGLFILRFGVEGGMGPIANKKV